jgi:dihydroorotate dehydrogenase
MRVGVNIGPNRDTPRDRVAEDYAALMRALAPLADFVVANLSSPNTPGLREWQAPERIREIFDAIESVRTENARRTPLLIKIAPDLDEQMIAQVCESALKLGIDGIVATNTTIAREAVGVIAAMEGGLSGEPLKERSRALIRSIYRNSGGSLRVIGVGGIAGAEDAYGHMRAGASLVELYTGLVYHGPALVASIKAGLSRLMKRDGLRSIAEAVGCDA